MNVKKILFVSGSLGLGHVFRDLEIAKAIRQRHPNVTIHWLADNPATIVLKDAEENVLPEADLLNHGNEIVENSTKNYRTDVGVSYVLKSRKESWPENIKIVRRVVERENFDLVIGDETYDITEGIAQDPSMKTFPFIVLYDFIGLESISWNPLEKLKVYMINRYFVNLVKSMPPIADRFVFLGEIEDVQDKKFGFMLPNQRKFVKAHIDFTGYILSFNPKDFEDKAKIRKTLGYGNEHLIICSVGGTASGKPLLDLCVKAFPIIRKEIPDLRMVLVCGPRIRPESIEADGIEIRGYVKELYKHFAASDLSIVMGGGTSTLELTALKRPFIYFPLEKHFEQEIHVAMRCKRHRAGIRMTYSETTPELLAKEVISNIDKRTDYVSISTNGAQTAAELIGKFL